MQIKAAAAGVVIWAVEGVDPSLGSSASELRSELSAAPWLISTGSAWVLLIGIAAARKIEHGLGLKLQSGLWWYCEFNELKWNGAGGTAGYCNDGSVIETLRHVAIIGELCRAEAHRELPFSAGHHHINPPPHFLCCAALVLITAKPCLQSDNHHTPLQPQCRLHQSGNHHLDSSKPSHRLPGSSAVQQPNFLTAHRDSRLCDGERRTDEAREW
ncbi:hypothetical protein M0R45_017154 [Rubus argutus]|uniref:Uncharacterized protein n=1 Tax=Rubus argutus TaxID=59490 RepID=A0AAW1XWN7_RUBAR